MKKSFESASDLDGYEDLRPEDQQKIDLAWEEGHVADEDIPDSARKEESEDDEDKKPKKPSKKSKVTNLTCIDCPPFKCCVPVSRRLSVMILRMAMKSQKRKRLVNGLR